MDNIIKIQKCFRGYIVRLHKLPMIMYYIRHYLQKTDLKILSDPNKDGRINSSINEIHVINILVEKFKNRIKIPKRPRMWYDILAYDYLYGWIPINIKITTTCTHDNSGNLTICVYSYTDYDLDMNKLYKNGEMNKILFQKLNNKEYNRINKKDYYFLVLNKTDIHDVIINSIKGLKILTPNINNPPFQICWKKNNIFCYERIDKKIQLFIDCLKKTKNHWQHEFIMNIRTLNSTMNDD